ncbi:MAG TPA: DUF6178 family protein, partial [Smithellaceae bacterium]|nr:DUF6178 family protein [Smithellaceae bacterium]HPM71057.1 DUF6178 family protein [Smithellaceae bacterium]HQB91755.1 DUF6178 family protein [Smithellaceae bacterium]
PDDFFWLIKRIGADDALAVLQKASTEQWQYLLDLEIWAKDVLDAQKTLAWIDRLRRADAARLAAWAFEEQSALVSLALLRKTEIIFKEEEDEWDVPPGYFTLDGSFYIKTWDSSEAQLVEDFLRVLAGTDYSSYRALLLQLTSVLPAEIEEELYRMRSGRLAEQGFAPFEEALEVYAPLDVNALQTEAKPLLPGALVEAEKKNLVPSASLSGIKNFELLNDAMGMITDPLEADRVRLEFTALCNKLIAADAFSCIDDYENLLRVGGQAAGYLHIVTEMLCGGKPREAAQLLRNHSLAAIFRVGFGFALKLQWRARRWLGQNWSAQIGKGPDFWGTPWSDALAGLLFPRPLYFDRSRPDREYRHFESVEELRETEALLDQAEALDRMLARLTRVEASALANNCEKFYPLLFNRWARHLLDLEPSFAPLSRAQAIEFFSILRRGETSVPYTMERYRGVFLNEFLQGAAGLDAKTTLSLRAALNEIWQAFCREYENIRSADLDARWSPYLLIEASARQENRKMKSATLG